MQPSKLLPLVTLLIAASFNLAPRLVSAQEKDDADLHSGGNGKYVLEPMGSPFTFQILGDKLYPVRGTDGLFHLSYAALVTNAVASRGRDFKAVPVDPDKEYSPTGKNAVETDEGILLTDLIKPLNLTGKNIGDEELEPDDVPLESQHYVDALSGGQSGFMFFDLTYAQRSDIPSALSHLLTVNVLDKGSVSQRAFSVPVPISDGEPVLLRPPLAGMGWFDANGCCAIVNGHRDALLHLNGGFWPPEQFAVDWMQADAGGVCCSGDASKLESWKFYGAPIYAAAAGTIVSIPARDLPDQQPLKPVGVTLENLLGNAIIENIGHGKYVLYAHLAPGSIPANLEVGTQLEAGEIIGKLGNSGNSGAPHLHFQVMDSPSALVTHGLPFVFDKLEIEGSLTGLEGPAVDDFIVGKPLHLDTTHNGLQSDRMPISSTVYGFN